MDMEESEEVRTAATPRRQWSGATITMLRLRAGMMESAGEPRMLFHSVLPSARLVLRGALCSPDHAEPLLPALLSGGRLAYRL